MRRRILSFLSLLLCVFTLGCSKGHELKAPANFYYRTANLSYETDSQIIRAEQRECAGLDTTEQKLQLYLLGPQSTELISPFPEQLQLISLTGKDRSMIVNVSKELATLSGLELVVACGSIAMTCMEMTGAETIIIRADGELLDGQTEVRMDADSLLLLDQSIPKEE